MNRLKKIADEQDILEETGEELNVSDNTETIKQLLQRISSNSEDIKSAYYVLLENLNALNKDFPDIYNELKVMVKLPNKSDINYISDLNNDMLSAEQMICDPTFLSGLIK